VPRWELVVPLACLGLVAGCGNSRPAAADPGRPAQVTRYRTLTFPAAGAAFSAPANWSVIAGRAPLIAVVASGDAVISVWRYPRSPSPSDSARSLASRMASLRAIYSRRPSARVRGTRMLQVDGAPAIEVDALERVAAGAEQLVSTHVYAGRSEVVLDEYAPSSLFAGPAAPVFARARRSLTVGAGRG
jgi:hypothetical protein